MIYNSKELMMFIEWLKARKLATKTVKEYARYFKLMEKEFGEKDFSNNLFDKFVIRHPSNVSRSFLKNFFEFAGIKKFEVPKVKGRRPVKKRRTISPKEIKELRDWLYGRRFKFGLMFDLSYYCALRREEVISIKFKDFYFENYASDPTRPCKLKIYGKGSKERNVMIHPDIMANLVSFVQQKINDGDEMVMSGDKKLFGIGKSMWHKVFKKAIKKTGSYNYTLHDLRRSMATTWLNDGVDLSRVKVRLGHSSVAITQRYINPEEEKELKKWEDELS